MKKVLIVVDYQNDFVNGSLGFDGAKKYEDVICEKIKQYREEKSDIIFTLDTHHKNYLETEEGKHLPVIHCIDNTEGADLYGKVKNLQQKTDKVFHKQTFGSLDLGRYLEQKEYEQVELCGLVSNLCVLSNVIIAKAALPNAHIVVDAKATGSISAEMDEKTFDIMKGLQVEVLHRERGLEFS